MRTVPVLKESQFRRLCYAQIFADIAAWFDIAVVMVVMVYFWGAGVISLAAYSIVIAIAFLTGSLVCTAVIDSHPVKNILLACNLVRAVMLVLYCFTSSCFVLLIFVFIKTFATAFYDPGTQVVIRKTFSENELHSAISISNIVSQTIKIVGPLLGGGLLTIWKPNSIFILCALFYALSAIVLLSLAPLRATSSWQKESQSEWMGALTNCLSYVRSNASLMIAISACSLFTLSIFLSESFYVMLFKQLHLPPQSAGLLFATVGFGGIIGSLLANVLNYSQRLLTLSINSLIVGFFIVVIGMYAAQTLHFTWLGFMAASLVFGISSNYFTVVFVTLVQLETPETLIGGVSSIANGSQTFFMILGPLLGSLLVIKFGLGITFYISGIICMIIGVIVWLLAKSVRKKIVSQANSEMLS